jgi:phospholipid-binding lipoprotein MlaA
MNKYFVAICALTVLNGCATHPSKSDPLEGLNRGVYRFNKTCDQLMVRPVARVYDAVLPAPVQGMVNRFFYNLGTIASIANDVLQADFAHARTDTARFVLNTTLGLGGLFDVAYHQGKLEPHKNSFGKTLAHWGYQHSMYVVLPLLGPSTVRDSVGCSVDMYANIWPYMHAKRTRNRLLALYVLDQRADLLKTQPFLDEAVDEYTLVRNAYLQKLQYEHTDALPTEVLEGPPD